LEAQSPPPFEKRGRMEQSILANYADERKILQKKLGRKYFPRGKSSIICPPNPL
jgi:hypothetical protein